MARVKVLTDRGWIEIPPRYTDISVIEDKRFEINCWIDKFERERTMIEVKPCKAISDNPNVTYPETIVIEFYNGERKEYCLAESQKEPTIESRPKGVWVGIDEEPHEEWECSNCGNIINTYLQDELEEHEYCHKCGTKMSVPWADMRGEE